MFRFSKIIALVLGLVHGGEIFAQQELVEIDKSAVIRWRKTGKEVTLFGVNYCLPSASDYRAVSRVGADHKQTIDADLAHLARMSFDGMRICFWGDWENSDLDGNLLTNEHLELMDYLIFRASQRGMYILLSPIATYSSTWPDEKNDSDIRGFGKHFKKSELGTNAVAIQSQQNFLRQILEHVNPYTGHALKNEPHVLFIELINEPWHHSADPVGSVQYINKLVEAVRDTGCKKLTFHNVSQDFGIARSIRESKVDGSTFAWYPSGLNANRQLNGNFLRYVDQYPPMHSKEVAAKPTIVYEFDMSDTNTGYVYPAMARTFRQAGAQFAAIFSYDMLPTAPYNLGWHTHLLNMVYTPKKAVSAIIAGEAMRRLPSGGNYSTYPKNCSFGGFHVSYENDSAEYASSDTYMYSNDTTSRPPDASQLKRIVGYGSSPIVKYEGQGIYFLDRIEHGRWRLEVYPDAIQLADPFDSPSPEKLAFKLVHREWRMAIALPDLTEKFSVRGINVGNEQRRTEVENGVLSIAPGVYLLENRANAKSSVPQKMGNIVFNEFVCPPKVQSRFGGGSTETEPPLNSEMKSRNVISDEHDVVLLDPARDLPFTSISRGDWIKPLTVEGSGPGAKALRVCYPPTAKYFPDDFSRSWYVGDYIANRVTSVRSAKSIAIKFKGMKQGNVVHLTLVQKDGIAWGTKLVATSEWKEEEIAVGDLKPVPWVLLPQGYPGDWNYWATPTNTDNKRIDPGQIERLQLSLRKDDFVDCAIQDATIDVEYISLKF